MSVFASATEWVLSSFFSTLCSVPLHSAVHSYGIPLLILLLFDKMSYHQKRLSDPVSLSSNYLRQKFGGWKYCCSIADERVGCDNRYINNVISPLLDNVSSSWLYATQASSLYVMARYIKRKRKNVNIDSSTESSVLHCIHHYFPRHPLYDGHDAACLQ